MGDLDMNLPGMSTTHVKVKLPVCKRIFKEEYHIHITGTLRYRSSGQRTGLFHCFFFNENLCFFVFVFFSIFIFLFFYSCWKWIRQQKEMKMSMRET